MVKVTIGNNVKRETVIISKDTTIRTALEENGVSYDRGSTILDGSTISGSDLDKTFAQLGYTGEEGHNKCYLYNVAKAANAA